MAADVIIYDLDEIYYSRDRLYHCHDLPGGDWRKRIKAGGYHRILVNGETVFAQDEQTGKHSGRILRPARELTGDSAVLQERTQAVQAS